MNAHTTAATTLPPSTDALRHTLEQELAEREQLIAELADRAAPHIDPVAWSTSGTAKTVAEQIRGALARLDSGTYGRCISCGDSIPAARLEAVPYAASCVNC
ncbi:DnaK suppressor protein [Okibacterium sp. HSC-33S16]|uniref:TraR/DksA family transcriptional regulator n=1 Tax=Okibacterium sp. HSC-33S16 TaxID=2910965 RepID=UPI00209F72A3|nr:TraR/DksA C4-type zinc finger protein [Okibacterium sp. HSC-33S16]MCP2032108.1 DnaK suppressor protein [Okibacterium sp. HSC-33S16]